MAEKFPQFLPPDWVLDRIFKDDDTEEWFYTNLETGQRFYPDEDIFKDADYEKTLFPLLESWKGTNQLIFSLPKKRGRENKAPYGNGHAEGRATSDDKDKAVREDEKVVSPPKHKKIKLVFLGYPGAERRRLVRENLTRLREEQRAAAACGAGGANFDNAPVEEDNGEVVNEPGASSSH